MPYHASILWLWWQCVAARAVAVGVHLGDCCGMDESVGGDETAVAIRVCV